MWRFLYAGICWAVGVDAPAPRPVMSGGTDPTAPVLPTVGPVGAVTLNRCDACGARAYVVWELDAAELRFCHHDSRENATALHAKHWRSHLV